jgi:5-methylcytosine-specific restriction endonuclease McrA
MIYEKIQPDFFDGVSELRKRIILFDPTPIYARIAFDKFKRMQSFGMKQLFPQIHPAYCACGCGKILNGRQTRWASESCQKLPLGILYILNGNLDYINGLMQAYLPHRCAHCDCENYSMPKNWASGIQVDHILAVQNGGSGAWLGNYQFLCHRCHAIKTRQDNLIKRQRLSGGIEQQSLFPAKIVNVI